MTGAPARLLLGEADRDAVIRAARIAAVQDRWPHGVPELRIDLGWVEHAAVVAARNVSLMEQHVRRSVPLAVGVDVDVDEPAPGKRPPAFAPMVLGMSLDGSLGPRGDHLSFLQAMAMVHEFPDVTSLPDRRSSCSTRSLRSWRRSHGSADTGQVRGVRAARTFGDGGTRIVTCWDGDSLSRRPFNVSSARLASRRVGRTFDVAGNASMSSGSRASVNHPSMGIRDG